MFNQNSLSSKLRAIDQYYHDGNLSFEFYHELRSFICMNYDELFSKVDQEYLINQMPPVMKEEVLFHSYGDIMFKFTHYFQKFNNQSFVWYLVLKFQKQRQAPRDVIYEHKSESDRIFFLGQGIVKLYAENNMSFQEFKKGDAFSDTEVYLNVKRIGEARAEENC